MFSKVNIKKFVILCGIILFILFVFLYIKVIAINNGVWYNIETEDEYKDVREDNGQLVVEYSFTSEADTVRGIVINSAYIRETGASDAIAQLIDDQGAILASSSLSANMVAEGEYAIFDLVDKVNELRGDKLVIRISYQGVADVGRAMSFFEEDEAKPMLISAGKDNFYKIIQFVYTLFMVVVAAVVALVLFHKKFRIETVYLISVLCIGLIMSLLIPLTVVPDESVHLNIAYKISNSMMGIETNSAGNLMMRADDAKVYYESSVSERAYFNSYYQGFFQELNDGSIIESGQKSLWAPEVLFVFSGLGITVGRLLGLGTTLTFMLGRWFNLLAFALISYYAIRKLPFAKSVVFVWAMLPITLQQVASYSYDCMINTMSILIICMTLYFMYGEVTKNKKKLVVEIAILFATSMLLVPCKGHAILPVSLFPLMIFVKLAWDNRQKIKEHLNEKKIRKYILIGAIATIVIVGLVVVGIVLKNILATADSDGIYVEWTGSYARSIGYHIKHPVDFVGIFINTIWAKGEELFVQTIGGSLGWLDIKIPIIFVVPFFILFFYAGARREGEEQPISVISKVWMWIVFLGICFLACLGMLLYWTPATSTVILGVQGRYFLPALVLPFIASRTKTACVSKDADKVIVYVVMITYIFIITSLIKMYL